LLANLGNHLVGLFVAELNRTHEAWWIEMEPTVRKKDFFRRSRIFWLPFLLVLITMAGYVLAQTTLKPLGLRAWSVEDFTKISAAIDWHHTITIGLIGLSIIFKHDISRLIKRLIELSVGKEGFSLKMAMASSFDQDTQILQYKAREEDPNQKLTADFVRQEMEKLTAINPDTLVDSAKAQGYFLRNGIITKSRLKDLLQAEYLLDVLKTIYVQEFPLSRNPEHPLDPVAVANYGVMLFVNGAEEPVIHQVRQMIRGSEEWRKNQ